MKLFDNLDKLPIKNGFNTYARRSPRSPNGIIVSRHILPFILNLLLL